MGTDARLLDRLLNDFHNIRLQKLYHGQVHIHLVVGEAVVIPSPTFLTCLRQHMVADGIDQPQIFRKGNEIRGRYEP